MSGYRISPAGVETLLRATARDAAELGPLVASLPGAMDAAALAAGSSPPVTGALAELLDVEQRRLTSLGLRVEACLTGVDAATRHYLRGDDQMAGIMHENAISAANRVGQ